MLPSANALLGVLEIENDPLSFSDLFPSENFLLNSSIVRWVQDAGGFAALGLMCWVIAVLSRAPSQGAGRSRQTLISNWMWFFGGIALLLYTIALVLTFIIILNREDPPTQQMPDGSTRTLIMPPTFLEKTNHHLVTLGGLCAMLAFFEPFFLDFFKLSRRRIWALAKLSFKEAIRRRVVWVFMVFVLIKLFPANWFRRIKPEYELMAHIKMIDYYMPLLLYLVALMASFAIPNDLKNQTIHTIVTKPVERFEIVLGRFLGYLGLVTIALVAMSTLSLIMIEASNIDESAKLETKRARIPLYGDLSWSSRQEENFVGVNVGREREYRKYLAGGSGQRADFRFPDFSSSLASKDRIPVEFGFDIYRTTKGVENHGVAVTFEVESWRWDPANSAEYERAMQDAFGTTRKSVYPPDADDLEGVRATKQKQWEQVSQIAEKYGKFQITNKEIYDYHTDQFFLPPGLLKHALEGTPGDVQYGQRKFRIPRLLIRVRCDSPSQFLGVAKRDLYILEGEGFFWLNFYKASIGLWCRLAIIILLGVSCSTYLTGVISFLIAAFLFMTGAFQEFIRSLAMGQNIGGGPLESLTRLVRGDNPTAQLDASTVVQVAGFFDEIFRWIVRRFLNVIPDTDQLSWFSYVAHGFAIPGDSIILGLLLTMAYMLPWFVLAYYLMRSREIAA